MLERVVINLVGNAVKFTPTAAASRAAVARHRAVRARGHRHRHRHPGGRAGQLFTRFFRSSLAQEQAIPGSGLGLSIAHAIVEQHGGTITVESDPGAGTEFPVRLPA